MPSWPRAGAADLVLQPPLARRPGAKGLVQACTGAHGLRDSPFSLRFSTNLQLLGQALPLYAGPCGHPGHAIQQIGQRAAEVLAGVLGRDDQRLK